VEDISRQKNATGRELSGGVLRWPGILEHSTKRMNSQHEESSLVRITQAHNIRTSTSFCNPSACTHGRGTGMIVMVRVVTRIGRKCALHYVGNWLFI